MLSRYDLGYTWSVWQNVKALCNMTFLLNRRYDSLMIKSLFQNMIDLDIKAKHKKITEQLHSVIFIKFYCLGGIFSHLRVAY